MAFLSDSELHKRVVSFHKKLVDREKVKNPENKIMIILQEENFHFDKEHDIKEAQIDLCISNRGRKYKEDVIKLDLSNFINAEDKEGYFNAITEIIHIDPIKGYKLNPQETIFTTSRDYLVIPDNMVGFVYPRNFVARMGLMVTFGAHFMPPKIQWNIPLQIKNCTHVPIYLYPAKLIQIAFIQLLGVSSGYDGNFMADHGLAPLPDNNENFPLKQFLNDGDKSI